ncbi:hypothetical protein HPB48_002867 [Haemaphysalis longicornis]|uniref:Uncharacterized protein n=1 Tax=Haemaphysalis longicornis TaxID=44386 RepID=A0A9J6FXN2_HAELO|nr:hypothetical protein HPB48_002867 [Haemaphysalis longicornis]
MGLTEGGSRTAAFETSFEVKPPFTTLPKEGKEGGRPHFGNSSPTLSLKSASRVQVFAREGAISRQSSSRAEGDAADAGRNTGGRVAEWPAQSEKECPFRRCLLARWRFFSVNCSRRPWQASWFGEKGLLETPRRRQKLLSTGAHSPDRSLSLSNGVEPPPLISIAARRKRSNLSCANPFGSADVKRKLLFDMDSTATSLCLLLALACAPTTLGQHGYGGGGGYAGAGGAYGAQGAGGAGAGGYGGGGALFGGGGGGGVSYAGGAGGGYGGADYGGAATGGQAVYGGAAQGGGGYGRRRESLQRSLRLHHNVNHAGYGGGAVQAATGGGYGGAQQATAAQGYAASGGFGAQGGAGYGAGGAAGLGGGYGGGATLGAASYGGAGAGGYGAG